MQGRLKAAGAGQQWQQGALVMTGPAGSRSAHSAAVGLGLVDTRMPPPSRRSASTASKLRRDGQKSNNVSWLVL